MARVLMTTDGSDFVLALAAETIPLVPHPAVLEETERAERQEARGDVDAIAAGLGDAAGRIERGDPDVVVCDVAAWKPRQDLKLCRRGRR